MMMYLSQFLSFALSHLFPFQDFDPVKYVLENIPSDEADASYFEEKVCCQTWQALTL